MINNDNSTTADEQSGTNAEFAGIMEMLQRRYVDILLSADCVSLDD